MSGFNGILVAFSVFLCEREQMATVVPSHSPHSFSHTAGEIWF